MDKNKLIIPISILLGSLILGGFFYASQINKQKSIEQYQEKEYAAKRKDRCYSIYQKELDNWDNVKGSEYYQEIDVCEIRYVKKEYDAAECSKQRKEYGQTDNPNDFNPNYYCEIDFTKEF